MRWEFGTCSHLCLPLSAALFYRRGICMLAQQFPPWLGCWGGHGGARVQRAWRSWCRNQDRRPGTYLGNLLAPEGSGGHVIGIGGGRLGFKSWRTCEALGKCLNLSGLWLSHQQSGLPIMLACPPWDCCEDCQVLDPAVLIQFPHCSPWSGCALAQGA